jgi:tetratricopeptide (TPR) repeat protein
VVYRARQLFPVEREVAVKIMHGAGAGRRARFELERAALARLDHPGVARVLDAGVTDDGHAYTVMDLARGEPLDRFCREQGLDRRGVVGLLIAVCEAVEHAHQRGVIHRDLKPSNVLARRDEDAVRVTVVDFGTAALADAATRVTEHDGAAPATLEALSGGVLERVSVLSGAYQARRGLAGAMLGPLERLVQERPDDDDAAHALAKVREELADIEMSADNPGAALPLRRQVLEYWERRARSGPATLQDVRDHAEAVIKLGNALEALADDQPAESPARVSGTARARELYVRAQDAQVAALERWPDDAGLLDDLCYSAARLGGMDLRDGRLAQGASAYERRLELAQRLRDREPDNPMRRHNVNNAHSLLAKVHLEAGRPDAALTHARLAAAGAEPLAHEHPGRTQFMMEFVVSTIYAADALHALGDAREAEETARSALTTAARVFRENGGRGEVAWVAVSMGRLLPAEWPRALERAAR